MLFTRGFSLTNFVIGSSALSFQVFVLFPWHEKLDEEFHKLKADHARLLQEQRNELGLIRKDIEGLVKREHARRAGWGFW